MSEIGYDVVVVGAGVTGLLTAVRLHQAGKRVLVLEARDRVGGRLWTDEVEGHRLELGGQWVSPDQTAVSALIEELGLRTFARYRTGEGVYVAADGTRSTYGDTLPLPAASAAEMDRLTDILQALSLKMDPDRPWELDGAEELDRIGFADWLATLSDDAEARDNIALCIGPAMLTKPTHAFSALQAIHFGASAGGFVHLTDPDFILDRRVEGGYQSIPLTLAGLLPGDTVRLGEPVTAVAWSDDDVTVTTGRAAYTAKRVVLAVPPTFVSRISFSPALPPVQMQLRQHQSFGLVIKLHVTYATPFWRELGLSGTAFSPYRVVHEAYDNTNHDAELPDGGGEGTLVGFVSDLNADRLLALSAEERRGQVLAVLAEYYGEAALSPVHYYESPWMYEEWTAGAYGSSFDLGGMTRYGAALREPVGPITVISSDVAGLGYQHVDGAVRVAEETVAALLPQL
jgi:putrescine oxidase